jgi:hypothetical protein
MIWLSPKNFPGYGPVPYHLSKLLELWTVGKEFEAFSCLLIALISIPITSIDSLDNG